MTDEPVLAAHLGHGQVEGAQAQVDVGEGGQRAERAHLLLWRGGVPVALQERVVVARPDQLRHHGQRGRLDVGGDRSPIRRRSARRRSAGPPRPAPRRRPRPCPEVDGQGAQGRRPLALARPWRRSRGARRWGRPARRPPGAARSTVVVGRRCGCARPSAAPTGAQGAGSGSSPSRAARTRNSSRRRVPGQRGGPGVGQRGWPARAGSARPGGRPGPAGARSRSRRGRRPTRRR